MNLTLAPEQLLAGIGALIALLWLWRASARRARAAADAARAGARLLSLFGRVLFTWAIGARGVGDLVARLNPAPEADRLWGRAGTAASIRSIRTGSALRQPLY